MTIERRLLISSVLIIVGLMIELASLFLNHPISFLLFLITGVTSILTGVAYYLISIVTAKKP